MPGRPIPFLPECYYHIYNRGNNRTTIFFEPDNYIFFLKGIKRYLLPVADLIAYCLMPTHYHLMIRVKADPGGLTGETPEVSSISSAMMRLSISYTKAVNKRFRRTGVLFKGLFKSEAISEWRYLLQLCAYIHANPVKDGLVTDPSNWPYSNYLEWLGERSGTLVDREFIRSQFPEPDAYRELVARYVQMQNMSAPVLNYIRALET